MAIAIFFWVGAHDVLAFTSVYPPAYNHTYINATTELNNQLYVYFAFDPSKSLTGVWDQTSWSSTNTSPNRINIDYGSAKTMTRIYYENAHYNGMYTNFGVKDFTLWGSNDVSAFSDLDYTHDTNWTQIPTVQSTFDQHVALDVPDSKYISLTNSAAYRYYSFKFADNYGGANLIVRRIELQVGDTTPTPSPTPSPTPTLIPTPTPTFTPTATPISVSDDFNRADSSNLGPNWREVYGDWAISGNALVRTGLATVLYNFFPSSPDYSVTADLENSSATDDSPVMMIRYTDINHHYEAFPSNGALYLFKYDSGYTLLASTPVETAANTYYTYKLQAQGSTISVYQNGILKLTATDNSITGAGQAGFRSGSSVSTLHFDNFVIGDLTSLPAPTPISTPTPTGVSDDFNRVNSSDLGPNWQEIAGDWAISGNTLMRTGLATVLNTFFPSSPDYSVTADLENSSATDDSPVIIFRYTDTNHHYEVFPSNGVLYLFKYVSGYTLLASTPVETLADTYYTYRIDVQGSTITVYQNGVLKITTTDNSITEAGQVGFRTGSSVSTLHFDNFVLEYLSTPTPTPNQAPLINGVSGTIVNEGDPLLLDGSFSDLDSASWTATVNYGDGGGIQSLTLSGANFILSHVYKDNGIYTLAVSITDNQGATGIAVATITVNNVNPSIGDIGVNPSGPISVNTSTNATASFSDPGVLDTHTAVWNWGDGTTTNGIVTETNGSGSVTGSHSYSVAGVYTLLLTVTDKDGGVGTKQYQYVVVYDPSAGFVTGGGQIESPAGAEVSAPDTTGTAFFGISAKYTPGSSTPAGSVGYTFTNGNLVLASTSIDWLVVNGNVAFLSGQGTINGSGSYSFLVSTIDGSPDMLRIKITDSSGSTVYDNQMGAPDTANPTEAISYGQIKVH